MNRLKLAVIGAGHLGRFHARLLASTDDVELVGIVDPLPAQRETVATECATQGFAHHREIVDRIDGAIIATPTQFHHAVAVDLLRRGIPVLVEKPLASTMAQCEDLVSTARRHGGVLQVGHIERFNPALVAAMPLLREPKYIEAVRAGSFTGRSTDIGVVLDLMIHDLDVVLALAAAPVRNVQGMGLAILGRHEDVAHARLEFENGCVANLSASRVSTVPKRQAQVWNATGFASIDFGNRTATVSRAGDELLRRQIDIETMSAEERSQLLQRLSTELLVTHSLPVENRNAMLDEQRDFIDCVRTSSQPQVTGEHGRDVVAVAERILDSIGHHAWMGRSDGPVGPLAKPATPTLRGPHWDRSTDPQLTPRRRAG